MIQYCEQIKDFTTKHNSLSSLLTTSDYSSIHPVGSLSLDQGEALDRSVECCSAIQKCITSADFECHS